MFGYINIVHMISKPSNIWILGENDMAYKDTCVYIISLKTFYEKPLGKTHQGKKSTIYAI